MCDDDPEGGYTTDTLYKSVDGPGAAGMAIRTSTQVTFWRLLVDMLFVVGAAEAGIFRPERVARTRESGILRSVMQLSRGLGKGRVGNGEGTEKVINREGQNQGNQAEKSDGGCGDGSL
jgi:hypothetical protein